MTGDNISFKQWCTKCGEMTYHNSGRCSKCTTATIITDHTVILKDISTKELPLEYIKLVNENFWDLV